MDANADSRLDYLDGSGVVIAVADTGIDMDHSCFRNSTDEIGSGVSHRKIIHLNNSIDWDNQGHQQFGHGTHIAGILAWSSWGIVIWLQYLVLLN